MSEDQVDLLAGMLDAAAEWADPDMPQEVVMLAEQSDVVDDETVRSAIEQSEEVEVDD